MMMMVKENGRQAVGVEDTVPVTTNLEVAVATQAMAHLAAEPAAVPAAEGAGCLVAPVVLVVAAVVRPAAATKRRIVRVPAPLTVTRVPAHAATTKLTTKGSRSAHH